MGNIISRPIGPGRGIGAGAAFATYELTLYLWSTVLTHTKHFPEVTLSIHVDDFSQSVVGHNDVVVAGCLVESAKYIHAQLLELGMPLADDKAQLVASSEALAKLVQYELGPIAGNHQDAVRRLGMDYAICSKGRCSLRVRKSRSNK